MYEELKNRTRTVGSKMPKKKTKSRDAQGAKAKDGKGNVDEVSHELDCRFCDFTADSEKILRKHIRSEHVADAR